MDLEGNIQSVNPLLTYINTNKRDAVLYKAKHLITAADSDVHLKSQAIDDIKKMLACINDEILVAYYVKLIAPIADTKAALLYKIINAEQDDQKKKKEEQHIGEGAKALPKWVNKDRLNEIGFDWKVDEAFPENTGMYFPFASGWLQQLTNFIMKPIVQIISDEELSRRRITEIGNGRASHVFELPSAAFTSPVKFETILMDQGYYHYKDGFGQPHLNKIKSYFLQQYPQGYEITNLGWQEEGFFAFSNVIYYNGIKSFDDYGLAEVEGIKYLSMGASNILKNLRKGTDIYKNDKNLRYDPAPISFRAWTKLMREVYDDKAMMGVAWCLLAINRDIVSARTSYCPIPYCYGAAQSGKSQFVASLTAMFTKGLKPFNLNQGTEYAFWEYIGRFKNVLMAFNEFDVQSVEEKRVRAFKGVADGEGRNKGSGRKNKSETQEVNSLPVLLGQYLATMDDNSILSRTTPEKFTENNNRPQEQIEKFQQLKKYEEVGVSGLLCEILEHRNYAADNYLDTYNEVTSALKTDFTRDGFTPKNRVIENYAVVLTMVKLYSARIEFSFSYDDFYKYCRNKIMNLNNMIGESNTLGEFWKMLEHLADSAGIEPGWDYKMETGTEVKSMIAEKSSKNVISFDKPTRLLFLRLNSVYPVFAKEKRNVSGKPAITESTIKSYLQDQPYYIGASAGSNFKSRKLGIAKNTSSMVLNYDMLLLNEVNLLERHDEEDQREPVTLEGNVFGEPRLQDNWGVVKLSFMIVKDESYYKDEALVNKFTKTACLFADTDYLKRLWHDLPVRVTGLLNVRTKGDMQYRNMEVTAIEPLKAPGPSAVSEAKPDRFAQSQLSMDEQLRDDEEAPAEGGDAPF